MSDPPDHSPSASETGNAERFWQEFADSPPRRQPREGRQARPTGENDGEGLGAGSGDAGGRPGDGSASQPGPGEHGQGHECLEWCPICRGVDVLRAAGAPEVRGQLATLQRDSLLAIKALVDAYAERSAAQEPAPHESSPPVQDIPID